MKLKEVVGSQWIYRAPTSNNNAPIPTVISMEANRLRVSRVKQSSYLEREDHIDVSILIKFKNSKDITYCLDHVFILELSIILSWNTHVDMSVINIVPYKVISRCVLIIDRRPSLWGYPSAHNSDLRLVLRRYQQYQLVVIVHVGTKSEAKPTFTWISCVQDKGILVASWDLNEYLIIDT